MKSSKLTTTIFTLVTAAMLTACGSNSNTSGSTDSSSRIDTNASSTKPMAYCNQGTGTDISAKLKVYTDATNTIRLQYVYARITSVPTNFKDDKNYFAFWKWLANSSGYTYLDSTALAFAIVNPTNGQALTGWKTTLRWSDVSSIASNMGITDPATFFKSVNILVDLQDSQGQYDVLKISNYDASTNKAVSQVDALLPLFHANPADYAFESSGQVRADVLQGLHPFKNFLNQGYTAAQFQTMADGLCF